MEIDDLKGSITSLTEKTAQDKESLKKANRAQKLRAERFEAAIEKCYAQLKEKVWKKAVILFVFKIWLGAFLDFVFLVGEQDVQLTKARLERDSRRQQKEQMTDETDKLVAQIEFLKRFFFSLSLFSTCQDATDQYDKRRYSLVNFKCVSPM